MMIYQGRSHHGCFTCQAFERLVNDLEWEKLCSEFLLIVDFVALRASLPRLYRASLALFTCYIITFSAFSPVKQLLLIVLFLIFLSTKRIGQKTRPASSILTSLLGDGTPLLGDGTPLLRDGTPLYPFGAVIDKRLDRKVSRSDRFFSGSIWRIEFSFLFSVLKNLETKLFLFLNFKIFQRDE